MKRLAILAMTAAARLAPAQSCPPAAFVEPESLQVLDYPCRVAPRI
jgi:hypothetical protein